MRVIILVNHSILVNRYSQIHIDKRFRTLWYGEGLGRMRSGKQKEHLVEQALGHHLRRRILRWAADRGEAASPKLISAALEHPLPNVSYHLRRLRDAGLLDEAEQVPAGGSIEQLYRLDPRAAYLRQVAKVLDFAG